MHSLRILVTAIYWHTARQGSAALDRFTEVPASAAIEALTTAGTPLVA